MTTAYDFDIDSSANTSIESSEIRRSIVIDVLNESSTLSDELIGNRFLHLALEKPVTQDIQKKEKTALELMEEIGLLGAIEDTEVTSENYKEFIRKSLEKRHGKES